MVDERGYFYISGLFSIAIYILTIYVVFSYMIHQSDNIKHFRTQKDNFLEVNIIHEKKPDIIQTPVPVVKKQEPIVQKEEKKVEPKQEVVKQTQTVKYNIQDLFGSIKAQDIPVQKVRAKVQKEQKIKSQEKIEENSTKASDIVENLDIKKSQISISSSVGEYDEYFGMINEILNEKWHNTYSTMPGVSAWVDVTISPNGRFDYKIVTPSYNNDFNAMLMNFLESMRGEEFPAPKDSKTVKLRVEFKETF